MSIKAKLADSVSLLNASIGFLGDKLSSVGSTMRSISVLRDKISIMLKEDEDALEQIEEIDFVLASVDRGVDVAVNAVCRFCGIDRKAIEDEAKKEPPDA